MINDEFTELLQELLTFSFFPTVIVFSKEIFVSVFSDEERQ